MSKINSLLKEFSDIELFQILSKLYSDFINNNTALDPTPLVTFLKIDKTKQQDICEFLSNFFNTVIEQLPKERRHELSDIINCKFTTSIKGVNDNVFFYTIPVNSHHSVEDMVIMSLSQHDEKFITKPTLFLVQLQRMLYNKEKKTFYKVTDRMDFSTSLNLTNFDAFNYKLFAVVEHIGSGNAGHYKVAVHDSQGWVMASDKIVKSISFQDVIDTSQSQYSPAYLLCYVSDFENDIFTKRTKLEQSEEEASGSRLNLRNIANFGKTKCAFNPPKEEDLIYSQESITPIKVITQSFNQSTMEFSEPEETLYETVDNIKETIQLFDCDNTVIMQFGYLSDTFSDTIPDEIGHYDIPLYILFQNSGYRVFSTNPYQDNKVIHVKYVQKYVGFSFDSFFSVGQTLHDVNSYATTQMHQLFSSRQSYVCFLKYFNNFYINLEENMNNLYDVMNFLENEQEFLEVSFIEEKMMDQHKKKFMTTKPIKVFDQEKPTEETLIYQYKVSIQLKLKRFKKIQEISPNFALIGMKSEKSYVKFEDPIDPKLFYETDDIRILCEFNEGKTALFVLYHNNDFIQNFFFDVDVTFEITEMKIKKIINSSSFTLLFHSLSSDDIFSQGNPQELLNEHPNGFFTIYVDN